MMRQSLMLTTVLVLLPLQDAAPQAAALHLGAGRSGYEALETFSNSMVAGLSYAPSTAGWTSITLGVPVAAGQDPSWLAVAAEQSRGVAFGPVRAGLDLSVEGYGYRDPLSGGTGTGGAVGVLPALRFDRTSLGVRVRTGMRAYGAQAVGYRESRSVHHTDMTVEGRLRHVGLAGVEGRYVRGPEGDTPFLGGFVTLRHARGELSVAAGQWLGDLDGTSWSVKGAVGLSRTVSLTAGAAHEAMDPLYLYEGRTSWSVGLSTIVGGRRHPTRTVPVVRRAQGVRIVVPAADAVGPLHVAGEFSRWELVPMQRVGDEWVLDLSLPTGAYRYAVRDANGRWFAPKSAYRRTDGMGGEVAFIIVSD
jgi:hypothetical protein